MSRSSGYPLGAVTERTTFRRRAPSRSQIDATDEDVPQEAVDEAFVEVDMPSRTVLMVLFHFPPLGGVAVPRNVANVRNLPRFGWTPVVVAASDSGALMDPDLLELVPPQTAIQRAWCPEPRHLRSIVDPLRGRGRLSAPRPSPSVAAMPTTRPGTPGGTTSVHQSAHPAPNWMWRLYRLLSFPDNQIAGCRSPSSRLSEHDRANPADVMYSTSAPITAHLVAGIVKQLTGVPWVAEFRDPWLGNPVTTALEGRRTWFHRRLQVRLERWIVGVR